MTAAHVAPPTPTPTSRFDLISGALLAAAVIGSLVVFPSLPERVPSHLGLHGQVDATTPRALGAFLLPAIATSVFVFVRGYARRTVKDEAGIAAMDAVMTLTTALLVGLHAMLLTLALVPGLDLSRGLGLGLSLFWIGCALVFPRLRRNRVAGIRTPWTLESDENWARTHRFGGQIAFVAGLLGLAASFVGATAITVTLVAVSGLVPVFYSYWLSRR